jgi:hypothetical protein
MIVLRKTSNTNRREDSLAFPCVLLKIFAYKNITAKDSRSAMPPRKQ